MAFNPFDEMGMPLEKQLRSWDQLNSRPYDKYEVDPYTRCRVIAMNGIEVEAAMFGHQFARHTADPDLKRRLAYVRRIEQQQQKAVNWLIPGQETTLEVTIGYEQVAVDLTAWVAQNEPDAYARQVYEFGLLEDFDHLYRYANLLDLTEGRKAADVVGYLTEITPGRPTKAEHRHPYDDVRTFVDRTTGNPLSMLNAMTVTAAEQQTMNFYMTIGNRPLEPVARGLYLEIAEIEEQHVTQYESLIDPRASWAEMLVMHELNECWLYHAFLNDEPDQRIRRLWELHLDMEIAHLHAANDIMKAMDGRDGRDLIPAGLPDPVSFHSNKDYVRTVLAQQVGLSADGADIVPASALPNDFRYLGYQQAVNGNTPTPSEAIITRHVVEKGIDYRSETEGPHPVEELRQAHAAE